MSSEEIKESINIEMNDNRYKIELTDIVYSSKEQNTTIIMIKNNMQKNNIHFMEIDDYLYENEYNMYYYKGSIYIIQNNNIKDISVSFGKIKTINKDEIKYSGIINLKSKYSVIFNSYNNKLIGLHKNNLYYYNRGMLFKSILNGFIYEYKHSYLNKINEINISVKISEEEINTELFFLDNYEYIDAQGQKHFHDNLKALNKSNTKLYINNNKYDYQKYFIPKKEGEYNIKIQFNVNLKDCSYMFAGCKNIINIDCISFNTKNVNNM